MRVTDTSILDQETPSNESAVSLSARPNKLKSVISRALDDQEIPDGDALSLAHSAASDLRSLCKAASTLRDRGKGDTITFSPKVFVPLTRLCRDSCGYCTFHRHPTESKSLFMTPEEVLEVVKAGEKLGCTEALFTLGERPEQRYPEAKQWLHNRGYRSTLDYLNDVCGLVLRETSMLPHCNPGTMSRHEMRNLKSVNASMGVMMEILSRRLGDKDGPHHKAPSKWPKVRMKTLELAGQLKIPFTTGILIGIGETREERIHSLLAIRASHRQYQHVQEVIIQNFRAQPNTEMANRANASTLDLLWTVSVARLILGAAANIQVPPNLNSRHYTSFLSAGINDWGGVSPLTIDYVNPDAPWPDLQQLRHRTATAGFRLRPRLPIYPEYFLQASDYLPKPLRERALALSDAEGYVKGTI